MKMRTENFRVQRIGRETDKPFSDYMFQVNSGEMAVAEIKHDWRGEDYLVRKIGGSWVVTDRLIAGGGPDSFSLNNLGVLVVEELIGS